eukprot:10051976-Lingulodinium_polyedra.AAC.1
MSAGCACAAEEASGGDRQWELGRAQRSELLRVAVALQALRTARRVPKKARDRVAALLEGLLVARVEA